MAVNNSMTLQKEIEVLRGEVSVMARKAEVIFEKSTKCIWNPDPEKVQEVRDMDTRLDAMEIQIDNTCMELLILKEPYAIDFRYIFSIVKVIKELERVGDQSKTIAKWSRKLEGDLPPDMKKLSDKTHEALRAAIEALIDADADKADEVMHLEFQVDELEDRIIESSPSLAEAFIAKALERIGDLATNIAEEVIFYVKAEDIRHGGYNKT